MAALRVRAYASSDHDAVCALWERVFPDDPPHNQPVDVIRRKQRVQPELLLVAEQDGEIVGTTVTGYDGCRGWVYHVAVAPERRREGVGRVLMRAAEEHLRALGCPKLNLQIRSGNDEVVRFYQSLGYEVEPRVSMGRLLA